VPIQIEVKDNVITDLSVDAKDKLKIQIDSYIADLLSEARLIEASLREDGAGQEITSSHIVQAARRGKNHFKRKKPWYIKHSQWVAPISALITGFLFDSNGFTGRTTQMWFFVGSLIVAIATYIFQFIKEDE